MMFGKHHYTIWPNDIRIFQSQGEAFNSLKVDSLKNKDLRGVSGVFEDEVNEENCQIHKFMTDASTRPGVEEKRIFGTEGAR